ncbi:hypothetical protein Syun_007387 [Stephania yunnanensis]|uniref:Uncharacterized protein n=1 Tax=Stephania yunnanensis TaxID=152371 RepID=A0AAP0KYI0_9MAGN
MSWLAKNVEFKPIESMPGGSLKILRENPATGIIKLSARAMEPTNHHTFGHEIVIMSGRIMLWNLSTKQEFELEIGVFLFTPAGNVHRVKDLADSEVFVRREGEKDIFMDEDLETAKREAS